MIERFVQSGGGVENAAWQVAHELARAGDDVTIVTRHPKRRDARAAQAASEAATRSGLGIEALRVPNRWQPLRVVAFSRAAGRAVARGGYDVVHGFSRTRHQDLYRAGGGSHADYLRLTHARGPAALRRLSPRHRVLLSLEDRVFGDPTQRIQCASSLVADALTGRHGVSPERILLLPNGVDVERFGAPAGLEAGRRMRRGPRSEGRADLALSGLGLASKGTLHPARSDGPRRGSRPASLDRRSRRSAALAASLAASGLADRVRFLGSRDDLEIVYGAVDGMVLPTRYDAFANVTLEAAAAGLPIITTRSNGAAEWLEGDLCVLDDPDDAGALAAAFARFVDPEAGRALGRRARMRARELDWAGHVARLREEYRRIVAARASSRRR